MLRADDSRTGVPLATNFNDKESLTADPTDAAGNLVYAVWDRSGLAELERAAAGARAHPLVARPDVVRAHDLGRRGDPGVGARPADLRPGRPQPDDLEPDRRAPERRADRRLLPVQVDGRVGRPRNQHRRDPLDRQGRDLVEEGDHDRAAHSVGETDPEPINCRPFITGNPPCTLVRSDGVILDLAVDYSGGPHAGRIYVTWQDHQDNPFGDDLILLSHSDDAGLTWSAPTKVNQTPSGTFTDQAWEPAVHVNSDGVVAVSYYDFRNDVSGDRRLTTDHWIVHSHDGGATWSESHLGGPFDLHQAPYARGYFVGDYQGLDSQGIGVPDTVHAREPRQRHGVPQPQPDGRVHQQRLLTCLSRRAPTCASPRGPTAARRASMTSSAAITQRGLW